MQKTKAVSKKEQSHKTKTYDAPAQQKEKLKKSAMHIQTQANTISFSFFTPADEQRLSLSKLLQRKKNNNVVAFSKFAVCPRSNYHFFWYVSKKMVLPWLIKKVSPPYCREVGTLLFVMYIMFTFSQNRTCTKRTEILCNTITSAPTDLTF